MDKSKKTSVSAQIVRHVLDFKANQKTFPALERNFLKKVWKLRRQLPKGVDQAMANSLVPALRFPEPEPFFIEGIEDPFTGSTLGYNYKGIATEHYRRVRSFAERAEIVPFKGAFLNPSDAVEFSLRKAVPAEPWIATAYWYFPWNTCSSLRDDEGYRSEYNQFEEASAELFAKMKQILTNDWSRFVKSLPKNEKVCCPGCGKELPRSYVDYSSPIGQNPNTLTGENDLPLIDFCVDNCNATADLLDFDVIGEANALREERNELIASWQKRKVELDYEHKIGLIESGAARKAFACVGYYPKHPDYNVSNVITEIIGDEKIEWLFSPENAKELIDNTLKEVSSGKLSKKEATQRIVGNATKEDLVEYMMSRTIAA